MDWRDIVAIIGAFGSSATAAGVFFAWWQIRLTIGHNRTAFEDSLSREYREISQALPIGALLDKELTDEEHGKAMHEFFHYIDLSNEEVFLRQHKRVSRETWVNWCEGIQHNLRRPAFRRAWGEIKRRAPDSFNELRRLEQSGFKDDPAQWGNQSEVMRYQATTQGRSHNGK